MTEPSTLERLHKEVVASYGDQYKDLSDTWKLIETKAQSSAAIGGVFLAAALAWARSPTRIDSVDRGLLSLLIFCLVSAICCSILAMRVRSAPMPPYGRAVKEATDDLTKEGIDAERIPDLYGTLIESWEQTNDRLLAQISDKADMVYLAQCLLGWAALLSFILAVRPLAGGRI